MKNVTFYHNNRCSKSRQALELIEAADVSIRVVEYMKDPVTLSMLESILLALDYVPDQLLRKGEPDYKNHVKGKKLSNEELMALMCVYPKLIERPIAVCEGKGIVARPPELIHVFLESLKS